MVSVLVVLGGLLFVALGYANIAHPRRMWKAYHWPASIGQDAGDGDEVVFRVRGRFFIAVGLCIVLYALVAT
jgi:hypothetical protein